jgi:modulator of FtsH protease HflC
MKRKWLIAILVLVAVTAAARSVVFVDEAEFVIVTLFERPVRTLSDAGLHVKWPHQSAIRIDRRVQIFDPRPSEFLGSKKKNVDLDVFVCWRVDDPMKFHRSVVGGFFGAEGLLEDRVLSVLADEVGLRPREALVTTDRMAHELDAMMNEVTERCGELASAEYGIEIMDVKLKRITLPRQARESVFKRMRDERSRIASQYRAEGREEAMKIQAEADRKRTATLAAAYRTAEVTRGKAEAEATRIYAAAHGKDPEFYELRRTLSAYKKLLDGKTTILLSADSDLFKYLTAGAGATKAEKK